MRKFAAPRSLPPDWLNEPESPPLKHVHFERPNRQRSTLVAASRTGQNRISAPAVACLRTSEAVPQTERDMS